MGRKAVADWDHLYSVFKALKKNGNSIKLKRFAEDMKVPYATMSAAFQKIKKQPQNKSKNFPQIHQSNNENPEKPAQPFLEDWNECREKFFRWEFKSLKDLATAMGSEPNNGTFRKETKGWVAERQKADWIAHCTAVENIIKDQAADYESRKLESYYKCQEMIEGKRSRGETKKAIGDHFFRDKAFCFVYGLMGKHLLQRKPDARIRKKWNKPDERGEVEFSFFKRGMGCYPQAGARFLAPCGCFSCDT